MQNEFTIGYSPEFYNEISLIYSYIKYNLQNVIAAKRLIIEIEKQINYRLQNPLGYKQYKTYSDNIYYKIYINNYVIFYTVSGNTMIIRRIIYNRRNFDRLL